jgi:MATE family multidrug resistance protein
MSALSMSRREANVSHGEVMTLAWPILVSMLSLTVTGLVDTALVSRLGTGPLAAAGLATTTSFVLLSFGNGVLHGVRVVAAKRTGAGDSESANRLAWQALWMSAGLGLPMALFAPLAPYILALQGASAEIAADASLFFAIRVAGAPILCANAGLSSWLQGQGRTRETMVGNVLMYGTYLILDPVLLFGYGPIDAVGVHGAAIASVVSWTVGTLTLLVAARRTLASTSAVPDRALIGEIWTVGAPMGLQFLLDVASFAFFTSVLARIGEAQLAAHVIALRINAVSFLPGYAIAEAASVLVGQSIGAGRVDRARQAWAAGTRLAVGVMVAWALAFVLVPEWLLAPFHPDAEVARVAKTLLMIGAAFQLFDALATVSFMALTGAGDTRFTMVTNSLVSWAIKVPLALVLAGPMGLGAAGAWLGLTLEIVVLAAIGVWRIQGTRWSAAPAPATVAA